MIGQIRKFQLPAHQKLLLRIRQYLKNRNMRDDPKLNYK
jgi:hypothetical protein